MEEDNGDSEQETRVTFGDCAPVSEDTKQGYQNVLRMIEEIRAEACLEQKIPLSKFEVFLPQSTEAYKKLTKKIREKCNE